ncbi:MAG: lipopolysaccharide kinase InaA family protein [Gemmatimonadaceae bacterium]
MADGLATRTIHGVEVVARPNLVDALATVVESHGTVYEWAATQPQPQALKGRAPVYVATLPGTSDTVAVRHAWHGGLLAPLTGDRFRHPTRAPHELAMSARLRAAGIPTTDVLGFARYPAWGGFRRVDVISRFIPEAADLGMVVAGLMPGIACEAALEATIVLLRQLAQAGVQHPDLNVKNILLVREPAGHLAAAVIDVDVIRWRPATESVIVMRANVDRLTRSMRKWRARFGCDLPDARIAQFASALLSDSRPSPLA